MGMGYLKRRIAGFVVAIAMLLDLGVITSFGEPPAWPGDVGIVAGAGIVIDADSKAVLFGQQIHVPYPPASILKLLTALVVVENCEMDETVTFSYDAIHNLEAGAGNKLSLAEGDQISVEDCREGFVAMMNEKAAELGCSTDETHFANPSGLNDDSQYVSAYDMALIAAAAFENEDVFRIASTKKYSVGPTINNPNGANISMEHRIVMEESRGSEYYCEGAKAGKTGYTSKAGNTLVTYAERDGRRLISVILKGSDKYQYYMDAKNIMNFGFSSFKNESVAGNEGFLQEQEEFDFGGTVYPASRLRLEEAAVTLPLAAGFSDAQRNLVTGEDLPADHPEAAVAMLSYTYNERRVGSAYIYDRETEERLAAEQASREAEEASRLAAEAIGESQPESQEAETAPETDEKEAGKKEGGFLSGFSMSQNQILVLVAGVGLAVVVGLGIILGIRKRKERIAREQRRERRRQRLLEIGYNEEEFEELMRKRRESGAERKK